MELPINTMTNQLDFDFQKKEKKEIENLLEIKNQTEIVLVLSLKTEDELNCLKIVATDQEFLDKINFALRHAQLKLI